MLNILNIPQKLDKFYRKRHSKSNRRAGNFRPVLRDVQNMQGGIGCEEVIERLKILMKS